MLNNEMRLNRTIADMKCKKKKKSFSLSPSICVSGNTQDCISRIWNGGYNARIIFAIHYRCPWANRRPLYPITRGAKTGSFLVSREGRYQRKMPSCFALINNCVSVRTWHRKWDCRTCFFHVLIILGNPCLVIKWCWLVFVVDCGMTFWI